MSTAFELLTPKIGNHPLGCPCVTCTAAVAKLKATPYVKLLESELIAAIKANAQGSPAVVSSLEAQVLSLRELLAKRDDDNRTLTNVLAESRKISQERESQLTTMTGKLSACQQTLKSTEDSRNILQTQLRNANEERETALYDLKTARDQHDRTTDELGAALVEVAGLEKKLGNARARYHGGEEAGQKMHQEIQHLKFELQQMTTERDGYAAELKTITKEANAQRLAADGAKALVKRLEAENAALLTDNASLRAQITQPADHHEEGRGARLSVIGWLLLVGGVNFLLGRWTR